MPTPFVSVPSLKSLVKRIRRFEGRESVSELFHFELDLDLVDPGCVENLEQLIGTGISIVVSPSARSHRTFHGILRAVSHQIGSNRSRLEFVPWLWTLTQSTDCRIFSDMTTREIVTQVLQDHNIHDFDFHLQDESKAKREYTVQYRETAFNFVSRLFEEEGWFYWFEHSDDDHKLIIGDGPVAYGRVRSTPVPIVGGEMIRANKQAIYAIERERTFRPATIELKSFNPLDPNAKLETATDATDASANSRHCKLFDFTCGYTDEESGERFAQMRLEEEYVNSHQYRGGGNVLKFAPGQQFELFDSSGLLLTEVGHVVVTGVDGEKSTYSNTFVAIPSDRKFRPQRWSPKPRIEGPHDAVVVGKEDGDEEVVIDKIVVSELSFGGIDAMSVHAGFEARNNGPVIRG